MAACFHKNPGLSHRRKARNVNKQQQQQKRCVKSRTGYDIRISWHVYVKVFSNFELKYLLKIVATNEMELITERNEHNKEKKKGEKKKKERLTK